MKKVRPNFQRPRRIVSAGFLMAFAGVQLSMPVPAVHAGQIPSPPRWIPFEMNAVSLCVEGMNQESSDPQDAVNTLRQARRNSAAAITNGGGANSVVLHNDQVIAQALMMAETDAARTPENTQLKPVADTRNISGIKVLTPAANRIQANINIKRALK